MSRARAVTRCPLRWRTKPSTSNACERSRALFRGATASRSGLPLRPGGRPRGAAQQQRDALQQKIELIPPPPLVQHERMPPLLPRGDSASMLLSPKIVWELLTPIGWSYFFVVLFWFVLC